MTKSESQNKKGKGGRKPKFDYASEEFLSLVESYAKKGFTDGEIAHAIGIEPETFCRKKKEFSQLSQTLSRARCVINSLIPQLSNSSILRFDTTKSHGKELCPDKRVYYTTRA